MSTPTPNSPDTTKGQFNLNDPLDELRERVKQVRSNNASLASQLEPAAIDETVGIVMDGFTALQQTIEAGAEYARFTDDVEHSEQVRAVPLSTITKAFNTARGKE